MGLIGRISNKLAAKDDAETKKTLTTIRSLIRDQKIEATAVDLGSYHRCSGKKLSRISVQHNGVEMCQWCFAEKVQQELEAFNMLAVVARQPFWEEIHRYFEYLHKGGSVITPALSLDVLKFKELKQLKRPELAEEIAGIAQARIESNRLGDVIEAFAVSGRMYVVPKGAA